MRLLPIFFTLSLFGAALAEGEEQNFRAETIEAVENYLKELVQNVDMEWHVFLTRQTVHADGSPKQVDTFAFSSDKDTALFNLSTLSTTAIDNLQDKADNKDIILSLEHDGDDVEGTEHYGTREVDVPESTAFVISMFGKDLGYLNEIVDTLDMATETGTIQLLEYHENGNLKRNRTTIVYPKTVSVELQKNLAPRIVQKAEKLIKQAYKVDTDKRGEVVADIFNREIKQYKWQVLVNATDFWITETENHLKIKVGHDTYDILGVSA